VPEIPAVTDIVLRRAYALASEAAFLWESRSFVARSSAVTFEALTSLDNRLSRLVRALSKRPGLAERLLQLEADAFRSGHAFVTATVALLSGTAAVFEELVERLASDLELHAPLASALSWPAYRDVREYVDRLLASPAPTAVRLGIAAAVGHGTNPGKPLARALDSESPVLRSTALEAVGRLGAVRGLPRVTGALEDEDERCRFWAAWSAVRLGAESGIPVLGRFANEGGPLAAAACDIALRALPPEQAVRTHTRLLSVTKNERLGVLAAGIIGEASLGDWLLEKMASPQLARPAGAAFCLMTGRDLRRDDLDAEGPRPLAAVLAAAAETDTHGEDEPSNRSKGDGRLDDEFDDELAWPDTARLREWWTQNQHAFAPNVRYLVGRPIRSTELEQIVRFGNQQGRAAAALELALLNHDAPLLDTTSPAHRQMVLPNHGLNS
jgi:uncharacterized protein (TIGR02270 family)